MVEKGMLKHKEKAGKTKMKQLGGMMVKINRVMRGKGNTTAMTGRWKLRLGCDEELEEVQEK